MIKLTCKRRFSAFWRTPKTMPQRSFWYTELIVPENPTRELFHCLMSRCWRGEPPRNHHDSSLYSLPSTFSASESASLIFFVFFISCCRQLAKLLCSSSKQNWVSDLLAERYLKELNFRFFLRFRSLIVLSSRSGFITCRAVQTNCNNWLKRAKKEVWTMIIYIMSCHILFLRIADYLDALQEVSQPDLIKCQHSVGNSFLCFFDVFPKWVIFLFKSSVRSGHKWHTIFVMTFEKCFNVLLWLVCFECNECTHAKTQILSQ